MQVVVWDLPLRLFHWLLVAAVAGALITVQLDGDWMRWHSRCGLAVLGLLSFRLVWGVIGPTYSRFGQFLPTPGALKAYLGGRWQGLGHNPLAALSVYALLALFGFQALSGLVTSDDVAFSGPLAQHVSAALSRELSFWHRWNEELIYALITLHVLAILFYRLRGQHLLGPMIHGRKPATTAAEQTQGGGWLAFAIAVGIAVAVVWLASGRGVG